MLSQLLVMILMLRVIAVIVSGFKLIFKDIIVITWALKRFDGERDKEEVGDDDDGSNCDGDN